MVLASLRGDPGRLVGLAAVAAGTALAFALQILAPVRVPLYDGVPVTEPYRYLHPSGDQPANPASFAADFPLKGGGSPAVAAYTSETPPQAQLVAQERAFVVDAGAAGIHIAITPVEPPDVAPDGSVAGNVYRFSVTDQAGKPVTISSCEGCITISLRAPDGIGDGKLERFAGGAWAGVETFHAAGVYGTNPVALGDYAIVTGGSSASGGGDGGGGGDDPGGLVLGLPLDQVVVAGGAALILVLLFAAALLVRRRDATPAAVRGRAIPSKRKQPRPKPGRGRGRPDR